MNVESLKGDEDGFDDLYETLPPIDHGMEVTHRPKKGKTDEGFQNWLVSRFGRVSEIAPGDLLSVSFTIIRANWHICIVCYLLMFLSFCLLYKYKSLKTVTLFMTFASFFSFSLIFSMRRRSSILSVVSRVFTKNGLVTVIQSLISNVFRMGLLWSLWNRSSSASFFLLLLAVLDFLFIFLPCVLIEGRSLSTLQMITFSVKVSILAPITVCKAILFNHILILISPVTLGISFFFAYSLLINLFFAMCGTSSPSTRA